MVGKTKHATAAQKKRMSRISALPCLPCLIENMIRASTVQHVTEGYRRLGHDYTYGSCEWHHQGYKVDGLSACTKQQLMGILGPSFAHGRRAFEERYGDERYVLVPLMDFILAKNTWNIQDQIDAKDEWEKLYMANQVSRGTSRDRPSTAK